MIRCSVLGFAVNRDVEARIVMLSCNSVAILEEFLKWSILSIDKRVCK